MGKIRIFINKKRDLLVFSFDGKRATDFSLSNRDFWNNPTYKVAYDWFYHPSGPDLHVHTQKALRQRYDDAPIESMGVLQELLIEE